MKNIHFLPKLMIFSLIIGACNSNVKNDQTAIEKSPKTDTSSALLKQPPPLPAKSKEEIKIENLKMKYKYIEARYVDLLWGDFAHYLFIDSNGKQHNSSNIEDDTYKLTKPADDPSNMDIINPKYKNKLFKIFYKNEMVYNDIGERESVMVIKRLFLIEE